MPGRLIFWLLQSTVVLSVYIPHRIASLNTSRYRKRRLRDAADTLVDVFLIREMECIAQQVIILMIHVSMSFNSESCVVCRWRQNCYTISQFFVSSTPLATTSARVERH